MTSLNQIMELVQSKEWSGDLKTTFAGVQFDSRQVKPGDLFVAIKGFKTDGHQYIPQAIEKGACGVVLEDEKFIPESVPWIKVGDSRLALSRLAAFIFGYPSSKMRVIGITGTNGKTTTTFLVEKILSAAGRKVGLMGTIENRIAGKPVKTKFTTPEALELQQMFSTMVEEGVESVVMEVSSHALALNRVADCEFDAGVFTNLTQDHLDFHENAEDYFNSKALLFRGLGAGGKTGAKYAVVNIDSPYARDIIRIVGVPVITYGINKEADVSASSIEVSPQGTAFTVTTASGKTELKLKLVGYFNVYNALAAYAVGIMENVAPNIIRSALEETSGVPGRFEAVNEGQPFGVIVDYAHTPDGLINILQTAREITSGRVITVFGCGGDRDRTKRPLMGEAVATYSDYCIVTSDNPRTEVPGAIIQDILPGVTKLTDEFVVIENRREAITQAIKMAREGDMVIIAGKGHENYQLVGNQVLHFDDREEASIALRSLENA